MKVQLNKDFDKVYKLYRISPYKDYSGLYFLVVFTGVENLGKNYLLKRSQHNSFMLTYVKEGKGIFKYEGKSYDLKKGSLIMIDCMEYHEMKPVGAMNIIYVHISNSCLPEFFRYIYGLAGPVFNIDDSIIEFEKTILKIQGDYESNNFSVSESSKSIYSLLLRIKKYVDNKNKKDMGLPEVINKTILYIEQNIDSKITLDDISAFVSLSKFHLESVFKKYMGMSIGQYIDSERLKRSQELLINSNYSILDISNMVGYQDSQGLIRLYKSKLGMTPLQFRKNNVK